MVIRTWLMMSLTLGALGWSSSAGAQTPSLATLAAPITPTPAGEFGGDLFGFDVVRSSFRDGMIIHSADQEHQLRVTGLLHSDFRVDANPGSAGGVDTFLVRRARLGIEANVFDHYEFRFVPDWGNNRAVIQDAYLNIHYIDEMQLQGGKFRPPIGYERLIRARFVPTYERSLLDQLIPARDVGVMIHGQDLCGGRIDYALSAMNGTFSGDVDPNKLRELIGRVAFTPFPGEEFPEVWRHLQLGISGSIGKQGEPLAPSPLRTPGSIPFLTFAANVRGDGLQTRWTPEITYFHGPLGLVAQYYRMDRELRATNGLTPVVAIPFEGYYVLLTHFLTGESRSTYNEVTKPLRPFDPRDPLTSPGAWELVVRLSRLRVGEDIFLASNGPLAVGSTSSPAATELTVGFNWYLNSLVRVQFNWEHAWYPRPVTLGSGNSYLRTNAALMRLQIMF